MKDQTLLVVEDERSTQEAFKVLLEDDYHVICVDDGEGTLRSLGEKQIDLVLLDYLLPDTDGLEVLREIRKKHPSLPVILITAYGTFKLSRQAFILGVDDVEGKPFQADALMEKIARCLGNSQGQERPRGTIEPADDSRISDSCIAEVVRYIRGHLEEKLSLEKMVRIACLSRSVFCQRFKKVLGKSFKAYVHELRMERAKELLLETDRTILQVGQEVGFEDSSYFARRFKAYTGLTPFEFRRRVRERKKGTKVSEEAASAIEKKGERYIGGQLEANPLAEGQGTEYGLV